MRQVCRIAVLSFGLVVGLVSSASATPVTIGEFTYELDDLFGPIFTVTNLSADPVSATFTDLMLHLHNDGNPDVVFDLGPLAPGDFPVQTFIDLSNIPLDSAFLTFGFAIPGAISPGSLVLNDITTDTVRATTFIEFAADEDITPTPVPEPATLVLMSIGAGVAVARRRRIRRP